VHFTQRDTGRNSARVDPKLPAGTEFDFAAAGEKEHLDRRSRLIGTESAWRDRFRPQPWRRGAFHQQRALHLGIGNDELKTDK